MEEIINVLIKKGKGNSSIKKFAKKNLPEYLIELEEKDGDVLTGLIAAIETYLSK